MTLQLQETIKAEFPTMPSNMVKPLARVLSKTNRTAGEQEFISIVYREYYVPSTKAVTEETIEETDCGADEVVTEVVTEETKEPTAEGLETLIAQYENFVPVYEVAKAWGLTHKELWGKVYGMMQDDRITAYRLQEGFHYTSEQLSYCDPQGLFFLEFPGFSTDDI